MNTPSLSAMGRTLSGLALLFSLSLPSHAVSIGRDGLNIGGGARITLDSAIAGLAFSNGSDNPFAPNTRFGQAPSGAVASLNVLNATVTGDRRAPVATSNTLYGTRVVISERYTTVVQPTVSDIGLDPYTGKLGVVKFDGKVTLDAPSFIPGVAGGGNLSLSDIKVDLTRGVITADVSSNPGTSFASGANDMDVFRIGKLSGATTLDFRGDPLALGAQGWFVQASDSTPSTRTWALTGWLEASQLQATDAFKEEFFHALDVVPQGTAWNITQAWNDAPGGWGSLRLGMGIRLFDNGWATPAFDPVVVDYSQMLRPVSSVPEPGAYSLALLGLLALGWKARTRAAQGGASCGQPA